MSVVVRSVVSCAVASLLGSAAIAAPYRPASDATVLETLPARADDPRSRSIRELRQRLAAQPRDLDAALALARLYHRSVAAEGDPRYIGYAQAALAPWWDLPAPPLQVRVVRAILLQFNHHFDEALADLDAVVRAAPGNGEAWSWRAAIHMVQARYDEARADCAKMRPLASPLIGVACRAAIDSLTGRAAAAAQALQAMLAPGGPTAAAADRLWALTLLGEIEARRGDPVAAEKAYREALALGITDGYLLAAYADFLLDQQRPREVLVLLKGMERSDLLLLRLALAAKAAGDPALAAWSADLQARFAAAALRGDKVHEKEEARFALAIRGEPARALALAASNYRLQREPADARVLLEAALAARDPAAAAPALEWMTTNGVESVVLRGLADQLKSLS
ncbi:hypothetical protein [Piscinibacter sakaiensis]|uniref:hypothetical protein n=1 Tax=Piscinibacter sakaiensis TaxID=1547922 RepID=UPI003AB08104